MTDEEVSRLFTEVYGFYKKYRNAIPADDDSAGWQKILNEGIALTERFDPNGENGHVDRIIQFVTDEFNQRARERRRK